MTTSREEELKKAMEASKKKPRSVGRGRWRTSVNWGVWVLVGGLVLFLVSVYVIRPIFTGG